LTETTKKITRGADGYGLSLPNSFDDYDTAYTTTSSYVDVLTIDNRTTYLLLIAIVNNHASASLYYKIWGTIANSGSLPDTIPADGDDSWVELQAETSLPAVTNNKARWALSEPWKWVKVKIKQNSGAGTAKVYARGLRN